MSNHEWAEVMDYPILKAKKMLNLMFRMGMQEAYGSATEKVREAYLEFLRSCPLAVRLPGGVFVCHSAPENVDTMPFDVSIFDRPLDPLDWQEHGDMFRMLWGRDYRPENARLFAKAVDAKVLIHGHDPCPDGFRVPNETADHPRLLCRQGSVRDSAGRCRADAQRDCETDSDVKVT